MMNLLMTKGFNLKKTIILLLFSINQSFGNNSFPIHYTNFLEEYCDACGCSNNGGSLGMGGVIDNNFIGIRYLHQYYISNTGSLKDSPKIDEYFNTMQVWSRIPIIPNLEVQVLAPFHLHTRVYTNKEVPIKGLGDVSLISNYTLTRKKTGTYNPESKKTSMTNHLLKIGLGIKIPTGAYQQKINNSTNPSFQLGTGSLDYISNLQYVFIYNNIGMTNYLSFYYKNKNKKDYKFGNQFNFNNTLFYVLKAKNKNVFVPSIGISGEFSDTNKQFGMDVIDSNGYAIYSGIGIEYNTKKITYGFSGTYPINQNLGQGSIKAQYRTATYINYNF